MAWDEALDWVFAVAWTDRRRLVGAELTGDDGVLGLVVCLYSSAISLLVVSDLLCRREPALSVHTRLGVLPCCPSLHEPPERQHRLSSGDLP